MKAAMVDREGMFLPVDPTASSQPAVLAEDVVQVTDDQYALLRDRKARWERGVGLVLLDAHSGEGDGCAAKRFMARHYHLMEGSTPVRHKIHDVDTDEALEPGRLLTELLMAAGLNDGDEFEICITPTGKRPHGDRWFMFMGHRPETDDEVLRRIENHGN